MTPILFAHPDALGPPAPAAVLVEGDFFCPRATGVYGKILEEEGGKLGSRSGGGLLAGRDALGRSF